MKINIVKTLIKLAKYNKKGYPFSACIQYKGKTYFAVNEVIFKNDPTAHAEIQVIKKICQKEKTIDLKKAKIYCSGEPCGMCLYAMAWANIKQIYYINNYKIAQQQGYKYDNNAKKLNKVQNLQLKITKLSERTR